jgi:hypothetical protein
MLTAAALSVHILQTALPALAAHWSLYNCSKLVSSLRFVSYCEYVLLTSDSACSADVWCDDASVLIFECG